MAAQDPWLLTPGPLTTSMTVKQSMLHDWGSRDAGFIAVNDRMRQRLVGLIGGEGVFTTVPMQGSGTFAVEAMIGTFIGAATLAQRSSDPLQTLRERVTSKGGTTYAAITSMEASDMKALFERALIAAQTRASELGAEFGK